MSNAPRTVVLIHGYLALNLLDKVAHSDQRPADYFRGVAGALAGLGVAVVAPKLPGNSRVAQRAEVLAQALRAIAPPPEGGRDLILIAHSMGGLDARWVLHQHPDIAARVHSLVTLGTPFGGSPVADALSQPHSLIPQALAEAMRGTLGEGLLDLTSAQAVSLTQACSDPAGIHRFAVVGTPVPSVWPNSLFWALRVSPWLSASANDGQVLSACASHPAFTRLPDWPVDHAGLIGWGLPGFDEAEHLKRYTDLVQRLLSLPPAV